MLKLDEIKKNVEILASQINAPANQMPTYHLSRDDGTPHIEVDAKNYYYIALERDRKIKNQQTDDVDELLYWVLRDITFNMATSYELAHREPKSDPRKGIFSYQLDLLEKLNPLWKERRRREITEILKDHPYRD
jgi:hypothetical protein